MKLRTKKQLLGLFRNKDAISHALVRVRKELSEVEDRLADLLDKHIVAGDITEIYNGVPIGFRRGKTLVGTSKRAYATIESFPTVDNLDHFYISVMPVRPSAQSGRTWHIKIQRLHNFRIYATDFKKEAWSFKACVTWAKELATWSFKEINCAYLY